MTFTCSKSFALPQRQHASSIFLLASCLHLLLLLLLCSFTNAFVSEAMPRRVDEANGHFSSRYGCSCSSLHLSLFGGNGEHSRPSTPAVTTGNKLERSSAASSKPPQWEVYVDQSKQSLDRGGSATLDAFLGLAPPSQVQVLPATLSDTGSSSSSSYSSSKKKGPLVRCLSSDGLQCMDVANVDSVDKVYRILTRHMQISDIPYKYCECLKWKYKGNAHLEAGKYNHAVEAYSEALRILSSMKRNASSGNSNVLQQQQQEGIILLMRATAYLQRAASHKTKLKTIVKELMNMVPDASQLKNLYEQTSVHVSFSNAIFRRVLSDAAHQEDIFRRTQYWHGLYQYALLQAAQDALQATQLLPHYSRGWARAGEILSELWKLSESAQYYEMAVQCDPALQPTLKPVIGRLRKRQELLESARAYGWSEDTLRLALDVAG